MLENFGPRDEYLADLRNAPGPVSLFVGSADEIFFADRYAALLKGARPDLDVSILPGLGHMDMILKPEALAAIAAKASAN